MRIKEVRLLLVEGFHAVRVIVKEYYSILSVPLLIWGYLLVVASEEDINKNTAETFGIVEGSTGIHKKFSRRNYHYKFYHDGKRYTGSSAAYLTDNVFKGNFYKVEFSSKNPNHNRMIFDVEYIQKIEIDSSTKVMDTVYIPKDKELQGKIREKIENLRIQVDSIKP